MPIITFKDKPKEEPKNESPVSVGMGDDYMRNISLPVNDDILEEAEIDTEVRVVIIGTVKALRSNTSPDYTDKSISVRASSIEVYRRDMREEENDAMDGGYKGAY